MQAICDFFRNECSVCDREPLCQCDFPCQIEKDLRLSHEAIDCMLHSVDVLIKQAEKDIFAAESFLNFSWLKFSHSRLPCFNVVTVLIEVVFA